MLMRRLLALGLAIAIGLVFALGAKAQVYVAYRNAGIVNKYDAGTGALITERFIQGLNEPRALCLDHGALYVLQSGGEDGTIGKYDADTGATINARFISSLRMPQAMTVHDGVLYVANFTWPFQHINEADNGNSNFISKYDASTGAIIKQTLVLTGQFEAALAVSGHDLFISGAPGTDTGASAVFDTETGAAIHRNYQPMLVAAAGIVANDDWVWFTSGAGGDYGCIYKFSATSSATGIQQGLVGYFHPLVMRMDSPTVIAESGEELFVGTGSGTAVSKYNATTGDLIKANFIADRSDHFAGIAVVPRATTGQYAMADTAFAIKGSYLSSLFWMSTNGSVLNWAAGFLVLLVVVGVMLAYRHRSPEPELAVATEVPLETAVEAIPMEPALNLAETTQEPVLDSALTPETPVETAPVPPASVDPSFTGMLLLGLFGFTLLFAGALVWYASSYSFDLNQPRDAYLHGLVGMWGLDPNDAADAGGAPVNRQVMIYPDHLVFQGDRGEVKLDGQWRNDGFLYSKPDGSGEVEVCHLKDPLNLELHLDAFNSAERGDTVLYKEQGSEEEMQAIKDRYPGPITYPPPADVFKFWMSEYELTHLPWRADRIESWGSDPAYSRSKIYDFHSDNPQVPQLQVTVKNHRVIKVSSGTSDPLDHIPH
jgi:hypothetical protein